jgi:uncharacterized SAM-binding protein YcdF (DUF218 family)
MTDREKFIVLASNDWLKKADAIILLEGDYHNRVSTAADLFKAGGARYIVVSGGVDDKAAGRIPGRELKKALLSKGVLARNIILEENSANTWEQAVAVMKIVKARRWRSIIIVASHWHQFRAFLTFLRAMKAAGLRIEIYNAPARNLSWFKKNPDRTGLQLLADEFKKIRQYKKHIVSFTEALQYLEWKEKTTPIRPGRMGGPRL